MIRYLQIAPPLCLLACGGGDPSEVERVLPWVEDFTEVVPGGGMPAQVVVDQANNNLDVAIYDGRTFLAFRTAPNHFASTETVMYVVSSVDQATWEFEGEFALGTDVREPQLVPWEGELYLYFAVLGTDPTDFEPVGTRYSKYLGPGQWSAVQSYPVDTFIAWRIKELDGTLYMTGYSGGENIYDPDDPEPIQLHFLQSQDATSWSGVASYGSVVQEGGGSESDFVWLSDGRGIAVIRNEAGDEDGFGSKICEISASDPGDWSCVSDARKYDSPNVFLRGDDEVWMLARRNLTEDGAYDLGYSGDLEEQYLDYQLAYWQERKRCTLWRVDTESLAVSPVIDLPSAGDTCFPEILPADTNGHSFVVYNYSNDPEGEDYIWVDGQLKPTQIYRMLLNFP